jgi:hypothetical protein
MMLIQRVGLLTSFNWLFITFYCPQDLVCIFRFTIFIHGSVMESALVFLNLT